MSAAYPTGQPLFSTQANSECFREQAEANEDSATDRAASPSLFSMLSRVRTRPKKELTRRTPRRSTRVFSTKWSERDERHRRQSDEGRSERARAASEFQDSLPQKQRQTGRP